MNYILFYPDEMRAESLACYGHPVVKTPNYDQLAKEGVLFENHYVQNPVCVGSRCALLTGWYPHVNGYRSLLNFVTPEVPNFFRELREAGYYIQMCGKNHVLDEKALAVSVDDCKGLKMKNWNTKLMPNLLLEGKDYSMLLPPIRNEDEKDTADFVAMKDSIDFIQEYDGEKPFLLFVGLNAPHAPYRIIEKFYNMYNPDDLPALRPYDLKNKPSYYKYLREYKKFDELDDQTFRKIQAVYLGMVSYTDYVFGQLMEALRSSRFAEDTTVIVTSDHGEFAGDNGQVEKWPNCFEDHHTRVPLIIKTPDCKAGHQVKELVSAIDIMPTVLEYAGVESGHDHFGRSLKPQILGASGDPDNVVYSEGGYDLREPQCFEGTESHYKFLLNPQNVYYPKMMVQQQKGECVCRGTMMRNSRYKLILRTNGENELYDMVKDPRELNNLYFKPDFTKVITEMKSRMLSWYMETSDVVPRV